MQLVELGAGVRIVRRDFDVDAGVPIQIERMDAGEVERGAVEASSEVVGSGRDSDRIAPALMEPDCEPACPTCRFAVGSGVAIVIIPRTDMSIFPQSAKNVS